MIREATEQEIATPSEEGASEVTIPVHYAGWFYEITYSFVPARKTDSESRAATVRFVRGQGRAPSEKDLRAITLGAAFASDALRRVLEEKALAAGALGISRTAAMVL